MTPTVTYSIEINMTSPLNPDSKVLALDPANYAWVLEIEDGKVLRVD